MVSYEAEKLGLKKVPRSLYTEREMLNFLCGHQKSSSLVFLTLPLIRDASFLNPFVSVLTKCPLLTIDQNLFEVARHLVRLLPGQMVGIYTGQLNRQNWITITGQVDLE